MKYALPLLVASANAAATGVPAGRSAFPLFQTQVDPSGTDVDTNNVKPVYQQDSSNNKGLYRGLRNAIFVFPTQSLKAIDANNQVLDTAAATGTRSFYQTTAALLGTMFGKVAAGDSSGGAAGATYAICFDPTKVNIAGSFVSCNGGGAGIKGTTYAVATAGFTNRLVINWKAGVTNTPGGVTPPSWVWNKDLVLASLSQVSQVDEATPVTTGAQWCSTFSSTLAIDGTVLSRGAFNGLSSKAKCTFLVQAADGTVGPTFKVKTADWVKFDLQFVEWIKLDALGAAAILPNAADTSAFLIGAYPTTDGVFINPLTTQKSGVTSWLSNALTVTDAKDPQVYPAGSIGKAAFYPMNGGLLKDTQILTADSTILMQTVANKNTENNNFNNVANTYNNEKNAYNAAVEKENARLKDIFKAAFDPKVEIPKRPSPPTPPSKFQGPYLDMSKQTGTTVTAWKTTATQQGSGAFIEVSSGNYASVNTFGTRLGYIQTSITDTALDAKSYAGHVFGRFGQGAPTMPGTSAPFYYGQKAQGNKPGQLISFFPIADGDTGLDATTKKIVLEFKAYSWENPDGYNAPGQPSKPASPMKPPGAASYLSVGIAASLVAATLI